MTCTGGCRTRPTFLGTATKTNIPEHGSRTHCRLGGFEPNIRFEVQLQQTVLNLVDEGAGTALVPTSMRKAQLAGVVFRRLVDAPLIEQVLVWSPANRNPCLARFLDLTQSRT